jgi:hypothetical protein
VEPKPASALAPIAAGGHTQQSLGNWGASDLQDREPDTDAVCEQQRRLRIEQRFDGALWVRGRTPGGDRDTLALRAGAETQQDGGRSKGDRSGIRLEEFFNSRGAFNGSARCLFLEEKGTWLLCQPLYQLENCYRGFPFQLAPLTLFQYTFDSSLTGMIATI